MHNRWSVCLWVPIFFFLVKYRVPQIHRSTALLVGWANTDMGRWLSTGSMVDDRLQRSFDGIIPANMAHSTNVGLMLGQLRRRWPNIKPALVKCTVFAWLQLPVSAARRTNVVLMLVQCLQRWQHIKSTFGQRVIIYKLGNHTLVQRCFMLAIICPFKPTAFGKR